MPTFTCTQVGYGSVAHVHRAKLQSIGVDFSGICDHSLDRCQEAIHSGYSAFQSVADAQHLKSDFWDVCVSTQWHLQVMKEILHGDPHAKILIEKPVCLPREAAALQQLSCQYPNQLSVNETYCSSNVIRRVKNLISRLRLSPRKVLVEMSKDRREDIRSGRFLDTELGVLGYEGSHMLAVLQQLDEGYLPADIDSVHWEDMRLKQVNRLVRLPRQGSVDIHYRAHNNTQVNLFSSMTGQVRHPFLLLSPGEGDRQRIISIEGPNDQGEWLQIVGLFEPIRGLERGRGAIAILREKTLERLICPIEDDHMRSHLLAVKTFFQGKGKNPCTPEDALNIVHLLQRLAAHQPVHIPLSA